MEKGLEDDPPKVVVVGLGGVLPKVEVAGDPAASGAPPNKFDDIDITGCLSALVDCSLEAVEKGDRIPDEGDWNVAVMGDPNDGGGTILGDGGGNGMSFFRGLDIHRPRFAWKDARSPMVDAAVAEDSEVSVDAIVSLTMIL